MIVTIDEVASGREVQVEVNLLALLAAIQRATDWDPQENVLCDHSWYSNGKDVGPQELG